MSMSIKFLFFVIAFMLLFCTACAASKNQKKGANMDLPQAIDLVRPGIVQIILVATDLSEDQRKQTKRPFISQAIGTGFLVNTEGYVITARHVIKEGDKLLEEILAGKKSLRVGLAQPNTENMRGNFNLVDFDVIDEDTQHDLIVLKLRKNPFKKEVRSGIVIGGKEIPMQFATVTLNSTRPKDGVSVGISGYPFSEPTLVTNAGCVATSWGFELVDMVTFNVADSYLVDAEANPGNSGGPIYSIESGTVIGVCVRIKRAPVRDQDQQPVVINGKSLFYGSGLTVVVPSRYVIELLKNSGITYSESSD